MFKVIKWTAVGFVALVGAGMFAGATGLVHA